jgi:hypothetical protein
MVHHSKAEDKNFLSEQPRFMGAKGIVPPESHQGQEILSLPSWFYLGHSYQNAE